MGLALVTIGIARRRRLGGLKTYGITPWSTPPAWRAACAPVLRVPHLDDALLVGADFDLDEAAGAAAGRLQLGVAVEHQLYRPSDLLGDFGRGDVPVVDSELAAKSAADEIADHRHIARRDAEGIGKLAGRARDVLRRQIRCELAVIPLAGRAVGLEAHVRDGVDAIIAVDDDV